MRSNKATRSYFSELKRLYIVNDTELHEIKVYHIRYEEVIKFDYLSRLLPYKDYNTEQLKELILHYYNRKRDKGTWHASI